MKKALLPLVITAFTLSTGAFADDDYRSGGAYISDYEHIEYAKVVNVQPIVETISYRQPQRECHYEKRMVRHGSDSKTAVILGSIIGGVVGNELGNNKDASRVGTVAGAVLGGSIAKDLQHKNSGYHTRNERVCTTTERVRYKEEVTGYNVTYKYRGRTYSTVMDQHPDARIRVAVSVRPADA